MGVEVLASDNNTKLEDVEEEGTQKIQTNAIKTFSGFEAAEAPNGAIGSLDVQDKKMQPVVVDMDVPKDVKDEWPEPKKIHTFYLVKYRSYEDPQLKQKLEHAEKDLQKKNQARYQITEFLRAKRSQKSEVIEKLKPLTSAEKVFRKTLDAKRKEMDPLQTALGKFRSANAAARERGHGLCSSVEELDRRIKALNFQIEHDNNTMEEDKQMIKELERLKKSRGQVMAIEITNAKLQETMGDKDAIQDSFRLLGGELDAMKKEHQAMWNSIKPLEDELRGIEDEINSLQEQLAVASKKRDDAFETIQQLRKERDVGNTPYYQYRAVLNTAKDLVSKRDKSSMEEFSHNEVEKFMSLWNKNKTFREDYVKRCSPFLVNRQLSKDGRMRNPDEEPPVSNGVAGLGSNFVKDNIKTENVVAKGGKNLINNGVADLNGASKENEKHVTGSAKSNLSPKATKTNLHETDLEADEIPKDNFTVKHDVDVMLLKEKRREEEIAKARQAQERKKKQAERAQAKAAVKAQKDAEKKLKEREKKARKKTVVAAGAQGSAPETQSTTEDEDANSDAQTEQKMTDDGQLDKVTQTNEKLRQRNRDFTIKSKGKPSFPKSALKKKQTFPSWLWAGAVILLALVFLVIGYYYVL